VSITPHDPVNSLAAIIRGGRENSFSPPPPRPPIAPTCVIEWPLRSKDLGYEFALQFKRQSTGPSGERCKHAKEATPGQSPRTTPTANTGAVPSRHLILPLPIHLRIYAAAEGMS